MSPKALYTGRTERARMSAIGKSEQLPLLAELGHFKIMPLS